MLRVAIIGCGKIADSHASQIQRIEGCEIAAVCDRERLMAEQFSQRFGVKRHLSNLAELLEEIRPQVVHVTTPPASHFAISKQCLLHGANVYVEKPFTLNTRDAEELVGLAQQRGLKITAGHDDQFGHAARRLRALVAAGYLGGAPVHMESYYCYEIGEKSAYAKAVLADEHHWVRSLPGGLLQNIISHGIARIAEFLETDSPSVFVHCFASPLLRQMGEEAIVDELRVIISEGNRTTAYFTFSSQMRPSLHQFRIYGAKNGLLLDQDHETLIRLSGRRHKSFLERFIPPVSFSGQYLDNLARNLRTFLARDFHMKSGMKYLTESFYRSITEDAPLPIPYREILLTSRIMDAIFAQVREQQPVSTLTNTVAPCLR